MRKPRSRFPRRFILMAVLWVLAVPGGSAAAVAVEAKGGATTQRVAVDQTTGFAIGGFDAVAFFIENRPVEGMREYEASHDGAIWRFASKGNRDAFADTPDLYAPQYGGYCARSAAAGIAAEADPHVFAIHGGRLYFFRTEADRTRWFRAPGEHAAAADRNWPRLMETLAR